MHIDRAVSFLAFCVCALTSLAAHAQAAEANVEPSAPPAAGASPPGTAPDVAVDDPALAPPLLLAPTAPPSDMAQARLDDVAEARYVECLALLRSGDVERARACFQAVRTEAPGTEAALKADASLVVLDVRLAPSTPTTEESLNIPPGRLGVTAVSGLFGAWNAVAGGIILSSYVDGGVPLIVGTGLTAVALGLGFGAGGYFLADRLKLDEGAARLVASGLLWGTITGVMAVPAVSESLRNPDGSSSATATVASIGTVVGSGYLLGGLGLLLASRIPFDEAQVGLLNSGGIVGSILGVVVIANIVSATNGQGPSPLVGSAILTTSALLGLAGGGALGRVLDMTWGEVLLSDLGGLLGLIAGGAVGIGIGSSTESVPFASIATASGMLLGYGSAIGLVSMWRAERGAPVFRGQPAVVTPVASVALDGARLVPTLGVAARF